MTGKKKMSYDEARKRLAELQAVMKDEELSVEEAADQIGRASCRERV